MKNLRYYTPGILLILLAVVILIVPEILVAFVAASIIFLGICALYLGHILRKSENEYETVFNDTYFRSPFHRIYYRWFNNNFPGNMR